MKISILGKNTYGTTGFNSEGGILAGPLYLAGAPVNPLEASSKNYVDLSKKSLNAGNITTGILSVNRLPGFNGEFTSIAGSNVLTLGTTGVISGTYTKVTVDSKGRITDAGSLAESDIPNLDWNKVTTGIPTTLDGYGIVDGVKTTGDTMSGALILNAAPTNDYHLATKSYVDGLVGEDSHILKTGDIVRRPSDITPSGFLRCNGGQVSTQVYSALFTVIGYSAVSSMSTYGNGKPWNLQYDINTTQVNDITGWATNGVLPIAVTNASFAVTKNYVYLMGGKSVTGGSKLVYRAPVNANGSFGTWVDTRTVESINLTGDDSKTIPLGTTSVLITGKGGDGGSLANVNFTGSGSGSVAAGPSTITVTGKGGNGTYTLAKFYDTNATNPLGETIVPPISISAPTPPVDITVSVNGTNYTYRSLNNVVVYTNQPWVDGAYAGITYVMLGGQGIPNNTNYSITYLTYLSSKTTTGASTSITVNGETFTFPGGYGGPASQSQQTKTVSSSSATSYSYNIASGGLGGLTYNTLQNVSTNLSSSGTGVIPTNVTSVSITGKGGDAISYPYNSYTVQGVFSIGIKRDFDLNFSSGSEMFNESYPTILFATIYDDGRITGSNLTVKNSGVYGSSLPIGTIFTPITGGGVGIGSGNSGIYYKAVVSGTTFIAVAYSNTFSSYQGVDYTQGSNTNVTVNGTTYTFPGGTSGPATQSVQTATLPGTSSVNYSYSVGSPNGSAKLDYQVVTPNNGTNTTVTINGTTYTFNGGVKGPATQSTQNVTLTPEQITNISYSVPFNGSANITYIDNENSQVMGKVLPTPLSNSNSVVTKNRIYLVGGYNTESVNSVFTAPIDATGVIGQWASAVSLPEKISDAHVFITKNKLYVVGGYNDISRLNTVYSSTLNADGTISSWVQENNLPFTISNGQAIVTKNAVYLLGGIVNGSVSSSIYISPMAIDGSLPGWTFYGELPIQVRSGQVFVSKNKVYLIAGKNATSDVNIVYMATINTDGSLGTWTQGTSLSSTVTDSTAVVTANKLNIMGGKIAGSTTATILTASISGGLNDYSSYYDGTYTPLTPTTFAIPDTTSEDIGGIYSFIKT